MALAIALAVALLQAVMPLSGVLLARPAWMLASVSLARAQFLFLLLAMALLAMLFLGNDFSVAYVAHNSNTALPAVYRFAALWGGHEGSLLLWVFMLAGWTSAVTVLNRRIPALLQARLLGVLGLVSSGFLLFMILTSNPFTRLLPAAVEGADLNPLLQDIGLIIHPPMLYMGYVGFAVIFAFAVAALLAGRMDSAWARWARPWALAAWCFLTVGIALGSWWAYYELGWGGWWFWDPVENASFMPWLLGTALLHSLAVTEVRGSFKPWTALLAILTFALCLLGTFLVRSGVLTSVHAFASDPNRGLFILVLLFLAVAGSLLLYAWRAPLLAGSGRFVAVSREGGILLNNVFLTAAAFCVLLGTLYPLALDALGLGKISVGAPYFNSVFVPLAGVSALLAAVGAASRWKRDTPRRLMAKLRTPLVIALAIGALAPLLFAGEYRFSAAPGFALTAWILLMTARVVIDRLPSWRSAGGGFWGMAVAHAGVAVFVAGVTAVTVYDQEKDVLLEPGTPQLLGNYEYELLKVVSQRGDNYDALVGAVSVRRAGAAGGELAVVMPEKRRYRARPDNQMTEAGIAASWHGDWYVSLGEPVGNGAWSARVQYKPLVRLIWFGAALMALGGCAAAADRRYRRSRASA